MMCRNYCGGMIGAKCVGLGNTFQQSMTQPAQALHLCPVSEWVFMRQIHKGLAHTYMLSHMMLKAISAIKLFVGN